jgi:Holliday junction resolvasome RuvABC endonuclease subunit
MRKTHLTIIGINPGTRYLGIAVLYDSELLDWRIKALEGKWSEEKIKKAIKIVSELIERYEPNAMAIKKLHPSRRSKNLVRLVVKIKELARKKRLKVYQYSIKDIEKFFVDGGKLNKPNLIKTMVKLYPALHYDLKNERSHKNSYYIWMFEAVAMATLLLNLHIMRN